MKRISIILSMFFGSLFLLSNVVNAEKNESPSVIEFSVQNIDTGESENDKVKVLSNKTYEDSSLKIGSSNFNILKKEDSYISEIEIEFTPDIEVKPRVSNDDETNSTGVVKVLARITYTKSGKNIKVTSASSRFIVTNSYASVSNRNLKVQQAYTYGLEKTPTSNALTTYNTNWGYVYNYGGNYTAKTIVSGTVTMSGMSSYRVSATAYRS